jgi:hypothetical protein
LPNFALTIPSQGSLASASPTDILGLLSVVLQLQQQLLLAQEEEGEGGVADPVLLVPEGEWFAAAVTEVGEALSRSCRDVCAWVL